MEIQVTNLSWPANPPKQNCIKNSYSGLVRRLYDAD